MAFANLREILPGFDAAMRNIDLEKLKDEFFTSEAHEKLVAIHRGRKEEYQARLRWQRFDSHLNEIGEMWREKERLRRARITATKQAKEYDFPDELLQMAIRSLDAGGSV